MKDISITNGFITGIVPFGNGVKISFTEGAVVLFDGAAPAKEQPAFVPGVGGGTGEGGGGGVGGARPETAAAGPSSTVAATMGGVTALQYPSRDQSQTRVTGVTAGATAYRFRIPPSPVAGVGRVSIAQENEGDSAGTFAFSTESGPVVGPSVLGTPYKGNMPVLSFQVGQNKPGYGPELTPGVYYFINAHYEGTPGSNQLVQIESHNRG